MVKSKLDLIMNNFFGNLNTREKNLILAASFLIATVIVFLTINNTMQNLSFSSKRLEKAKTDYEYVAIKAQQLSNALINQSNDPTEIKSFFVNSINLDIKNLKVAKIENYLKISFETMNLKESISIADEITSMLNKDFSKVAYSKNDKGSVTELFIINP